MASERDDEHEGRSEVPITDLSITIHRRKPGRRWLRVRLAPFEAAIGAIVIVQSIVALGQWNIINPSEVLLPEWLRIAFNCAYLMAGLAILAGLLWPRGDVEGAGLILLAVIVLGRSIMFGQYLGWGVQALTSVAFGVFVALAAVARISLLVGGKRDDDK